MCADLRAGINLKKEGIEEFVNEWRTIVVVAQELREEAFVLHELRDEQSYCVRVRENGFASSDAFGLVVDDVLEPFFDVEAQVDKVCIVTEKKISVLFRYFIIHKW